MSRLEDAVQAVEDRKQAVFDQHDEAEMIFGSNFQDRVMFSGFDLNYDEMQEIAQRVATAFAAMVVFTSVSPVDLYASAWVEGLLTGMFYGKALVTQDTKVTDNKDN